MSTTTVAFGLGTLGQVNLDFDDNDGRLRIDNDSLVALIELGKALPEAPSWVIVEVARAAAMCRLWGNDQVWRDARTDLLPPDVSIAVDGVTILGVGA